MTKLTCFKAYDIRGELNIEFNDEICYRIARGFAEVLNAKTVVIGRDSRETSPKFAEIFCNGLVDQGVNVLDIGLAGTEEMYWATNQFEACGGVEVTASHNPKNYNGLKMVKSGSQPLKPIGEFNLIKEKAERNKFSKSDFRGKVINVKAKAKASYISKLSTFIDKNNKRKLKIVVNSGNGAAGPTFDLLERELLKSNENLRFCRMHHEPKGDFPNGVPNPMITANQWQTSEKVVKESADLGVAFDGDFDRCFFFDENGSFVSGEYIVGLLAESFLKNYPGSKIVHDTRVVWNTLDILKINGGTGVKSKTGHSFIKQEMRKNDAIYGGEISAHHYFKDFAFCDSGMIPFILVLNLLSQNNNTFSLMINKMKVKYPSSGEINFVLDNPMKKIDEVLNFYERKAKKIEYLDGLSITFDDWRFNLRTSNTESMLRLNVESKGDTKLINTKTNEIRQILTTI